MAHPMFTIAAVTSLTVLVAWIYWCAWQEARQYRRDDAERAQGVRYVWRGDHIERIEPASSPRVLRAPERVTP